jgi:hypothetical protein
MSIIPAIVASVNLPGLAVALVLLALAAYFFVASWRSSNGFEDGCGKKSGVVVMFLLSLGLVAAALLYGACSIINLRL